MASKHHRRVDRSVKTGEYVLTSKRGEKFSAVEGLQLTQRMSTVVQKASGGRYLSSDERRALVKEALRKK